MPVSGPPLPSAIASSAAFAVARAPSASTVTNAFSAGLCRAIRSSASRASSTADTRLAWSACESSTMVSVIRQSLLDDLGHQVQAVLDRGRDALVERVGVG